MNLPEKIQLLRKEKGETQKDLADILNIGISTLKTYENINGLRKPDIDTLKKIKEHYEVTYEYLLDDECENRTNETVDIGKELNLSDKSINMIKNLSKDLCYDDNLSKYLNHFIENIYFEGFFRCIKHIKEYYDFRISIVALEKQINFFDDYIIENIETEKVQELLNIFSKNLDKICSSRLVHSVITSYSYLDELNEIFSDILINVTNKDQNKTKKCITNFIDCLLKLSEQLYLNENVSKYNLTDRLNYYFEKLSPTIYDTTLIYFKDLEPFYNEISDNESDLGFSNEVINKTKKILKEKNLKYIDVSKI